MEKSMKRTVILALLTLVSVGMRAQDETSKVAVDIATFEGGTITEKEQSRVAAKDEQEVVTYTVTITVTPDEGFYITKDDIFVEVALPLEKSETRGEGDERMQLGQMLELQGPDPADLTAPRDYTFTIEEGLAAWVKEARFHSAALVIGSDVTRLDDESLGGVTSITIENADQVVLLGGNDVTGLTVIVPANLYNAYKTTPGWKDANITVDEAKSVEMGVSFTAQNHYTVFFSEQALVTPSVLKAYMVTGLDNDGNLVLTDVEGVIPAGEPVLLFSKDIDDNDFRTAPASVQNPDDAVTSPRAGAARNALQVVTDRNKTDERGLLVNLGQVYMLYRDVFYVTQAGYIPVGGIYLDPTLLTAVNNGTTTERARLYIGDDAQGATAIASHRSPLDASLSDAWYSIDGRRLNTVPTRKGVYINGGKKVVIK